jgi:arginase
MLNSERELVVLDAPSNLGLRPPAPGAVPGVYKLAGALRDKGLLERLVAADGGVVVPPRYQSQWKRGDGVRNERAIERFSSRLADRVGALLDRGSFPVVLGGDCSILLGNMLALRRRGRYGLVFVDGHSDFRHPGNPTPSVPRPARISRWLPAAVTRSRTWRIAGLSFATATSSRSACAAATRRSAS